MKLKSLLVAATASAMLSAPAFAADINLTMTGVKNDKGQMVIRLFNKMQADLFPAGVAMREEKTAAAKGEVKFTLKDVPNGTYAIGVYHDQDSNGQLKKNFIGAPAEPVANTGKKVMLMPKFKDSSFELTDAGIDVVAQF